MKGDWQFWNRLGLDCLLASPARQKYVSCWQNCMVHHNNHVPRAKLGTAYCNWPRHTGEATSRAQHRGAALGL